MAILTKNSKTLYSPQLMDSGTVPTAVSTSRWVPKESTLRTWMPTGTSTGEWFVIAGKLISSICPKSARSLKPITSRRKKAPKTSSWTSYSTSSGSRPKAWLRKAGKRKLLKRSQSNCSCLSPGKSMKILKSPLCTIWRAKSNIRICSPLSMTSKKSFMHDFSLLLT